MGNRLFGPVGPLRAGTARDMTTGGHVAAGHRGRP